MMTLCVCWLLRSIVHMLVSSEITRYDHCFIACSRHVYMGVILRTHPIRGELHIQRNANGEVVIILCYFSFS